MKKKCLIFELWFNKNIAWFLTNERKRDRLLNLIKLQENQLEKLD